MYLQRTKFVVWNVKENDAVYCDRRVVAAVLICFCDESCILTSRYKISPQPSFVTLGGWPKQDLIRSIIVGN
ncbi:hypothetical protein J6590_066036 [Homalodisca vitripennis]|nr:hypothetical protein J6590_066036 [Homalodisca vitripennis]